jgi:crotonobetaine/carnitine-CoA ligase
MQSPISIPATGHRTDVWSLLELWVARRPDAAFLEWHPYDGVGRTWTYAAIAADASAAAAGLAARGVVPGDRVLIHLDNSPEFVISWLACAALGVTAVTTNTRSARDELAYFADDSAVIGAITQPLYADLVAASAPGLSWMTVTDHDAGTESDVTGGGDPFRSLLAAGRSAGSLPARDAEPARMMSVQYTSGTTSRPKGVVWTHANALWGARINAVHEGLRADDCHLVYLPLFHANALSYSMLATLWVGARMVLVPKWSTSRFWDVSMEHGCTFLSTIGLSLRSLLTGATGEVPAGHSYRLLGGPICDTPVDSVLGTKSIGWWGMTETISHGIVGSPTTPDRPGAIGRPAPEYGIAVVRDDGVTPVEAEETGDLLFRGEPGVSMFAEYLNQPQATADSFDDHGWFRTGDRVIVHADGYITFADRSKDMLKVGAENVAASEIERVIMTSGAVREAAVVGRRDAKLDEVPVAFVTVAGDIDGDTEQRVAEQVIAACANDLADFKVPREVYVVRELPRSTLAKVNKVKLRAVAEPGADRAAAAAEWLESARVDPSGDSTEG